MKNDPSNPILVSTENLNKYGFVCFYLDNDPELTDDFWLREIKLGARGKSVHQFQTFQIPKDLLIQLSHETKIVHDDHFRIRSGQAAIQIVKLLAERAGWNQTAADLEMMFSHDMGGIFLAKYHIHDHEIPLGSGVSLPVHGHLAWIGMILVHPELRRQGIARSIMESCLAHARLVQQKSIVGLDATPLGKQVYDSLGFKDSFLIWRSTISTDWGENYISSKKNLPFNVDMVKDYLMMKNYPERLQIIELLEKLPDSQNLMVGSADQLHGFVMSRPGRLKPFIGPLIADTREIARELLMDMLKHWKSIGYSDVFIDIPEQHIRSEALFVNLEHLRELQEEQIPIKPVRSLMRMYQLISNKKDVESYSQMDQSVLAQTIHGYKATVNFVEKERYKLVPIMYGTAGPEWS